MAQNGSFRGSLILGLCTILLLLVATPGAWATGQPEAEERIIRIGTVLPLSGELEQFGVLLRRGYEMWSDQVAAGGGIEQGGRRFSVELIVRDDASDPARTARLTERLIIEEGVTVLLGPFGVGQTLAMARVAEEYEVPIIAPSGGIDLIADRHDAAIYGVLPPAGEAFGSFLDMVARRRDGMTGGAASGVEANDDAADDGLRIALLAREGVFTEAVAAGARRHAERLNLEVVFEERYSAGSGLAAAARRALRVNPAVVILAGSFEDSVTLLGVLRAWVARQNDESRRRITLGLLAGPDTLEFTRRLDTPESNESLPGVFGTAWWTPLSAYEGPLFGSAVDFAERYAERYGEVPTYHTAAAAQAGLILQRAFETAGGTDLLSLTESLRDLQLRSFWGPVGFDSRGINSGGAAVAVQIQEGRVVTAWPPEAAVAPPLW